MKSNNSIPSCESCAFKSFLFSNLQPKDLLRVNLSRKEKEFSKGEVIVKQGDEISTFMYLRYGLLKISIERFDRKNQIISIARPLDFIGLLSVFSETRYQYTVTAIEDSALCFIDMDLMKDIIRHDGNFALTLLEDMSNLNESIMHNWLMINQKNLRGRIAYILLFFCNEVYGKEEYSLPVSRKEIAELINMRTENVIRILSEFRKDKIIEIEGKVIRIIKKDKLEQIAEFG